MDPEPLARSSPGSDPLGVLAGRYQLERELGRGAMGRVFTAHDLRLRRPVAVKVLLAKALEPVALERFWREARLAGSLGHPNIVAVHDVGEHEGRPFLVQELLRGQSLRTVMAAGPLAPERALALALQLVRGLSEAHRAGVIHRDLKPENLFLTDASALKILDFGLAKAQGTGTLDEGEDGGVNTSTGTVVGTVSYMAPEQARGLPLDARADLFSVGVILFEMLAGVRPFQRASLLETAYALLNEPAAPLPDHLPARFRSVVERCLEKQPEHRFQTAQSLLEALEALDSGSRESEHEPASRRQLLRRAAWLGLGTAATAVAATLLTRAWPRSEPGSRLEARALGRERTQPARDAFQQGERAYLLDDLEAAAAAFRRALELEPGFALASYRLGVSLRFSDAGAARDAISAALRVPAALEAVDLRLVEALESSTNGALVEAERTYRELLDAEPAEAEGWTRLGELLLHAAPYRGHPLSVAIDPLNRGLVLEPGTASSLSSLMDIAHQQGDRVLVASLAARHAAVVGSGRRALPQRWLEAYASGDEGTLVRLQEGLDREPVHDVQAAWLRAAWAPTLEPALGLARAFSKSADADRRPTGLLCLALTEAAAGRPAAARATLEQSLALRVTPRTALFSAWLAGLDFFPDPSSAGGGARAQVRKALQRIDASHAETVRGQLLSAMGRLALLEGDRRTTRETIEALRQLPPLPGSSLHADLAQGLAAHLALSELGAEAAANELSRLQLREPLRYAAAFAGSAEPLLQADVAAQRGVPEEAARWLTSAAFYHPAEVVLAAPRALRLGRVEEARGRPVQAGQAFRRFIGRWSAAEPALAVEVRRAQERLGAIGAPASGQ